MTNGSKPEPNIIMAAVSHSPPDSFAGSSTNYSSWSESVPEIANFNVFERLVSKQLEDLDGELVVEINHDVYAYDFFFKRDKMITSTRLGPSSFAKIAGNHVALDQMAERIAKRLANEDNAVDIKEYAINKLLGKK